MNENYGRSTVTIVLVGNGKALPVPNFFAVIPVHAKLPMRLTLHSLTKSKPAEAGGTKINKRVRLYAQQNLT